MVGSQDWAVKQRQRQRVKRSRQQKTCRANVQHAWGTHARWIVLIVSQPCAMDACKCLPVCLCVPCCSLHLSPSSTHCPECICCCPTPCPRLSPPVPTCPLSLAPTPLSPPASITNPLVSGAGMLAIKVHTVAICSRPPLLQQCCCQTSQMFQLPTAGPPLVHA